MITKSIEQRPTRLAIAVVTVGIACGAAGRADAGDVRDFITDLYGGDGITLPNPTHRAHFSQDTLQELGQLSEDVTRATSFAPFNSSASSITYDIEAGVPVRSKASLGPLIAERAKTIGKGRVNFGFSYTNIEYKEYEGDDLNDLSVTATHDDCCSPNADFNPGDPIGPGNLPFNPTEPDGMLGGTPQTQFELDTIRIDLDVHLEQEIFAPFFTFGVTDHWDVGGVLPFVKVDAKVKSEYTVLRTSGLDTSSFHPRQTDPNEPDYYKQSNREDASGIGDARIRTKYNLSTENKWGEWTPDTAIAGQVTVPTGDENDLLGTGEWGFSSVFIASKEIWRFTPHINVGYEVFSGGQENNLKYAFSNEIRFTEQVTGITEVIGRWEPDGDGTGDLVDFSVGAKWNPIGDVVLTSNFLIPINKSTGLRPDFIWGLAAEIAF